MAEISRTYNSIDDFMDKPFTIPTKNSPGLGSVFSNDLKAMSSDEFLKYIIKEDLGYQKDFIVEKFKKAKRNPKRFFKNQHAPSLSVELYFEKVSDEKKIAHPKNGPKIGHSSLYNLLTFYINSNRNHPGSAQSVKKQPDQVGKVLPEQYNQYVPGDNTLAQDKANQEPGSRISLCSRVNSCFSSLKQKGKPSGEGKQRTYLSESYNQSVPGDNTLTQDKANQEPASRISLYSRVNSCFSSLKQKGKPSGEGKQRTYSTNKQRMFRYGALIAGGAAAVAAVSAFYLSNYDNTLLEQISNSRHLASFLDHKLQSCLDANINAAGLVRKLTTSIQYISEKAKDIGTVAEGNTLTGMIKQLYNATVGNLPSPDKVTSLLSQVCADNNLLSPDKYQSLIDAGVQVTKGNPNLIFPGQELNLNAVISDSVSNLNSQLGIAVEKVSMLSDNVHRLYQLKGSVDSDVLLRQAELINNQHLMTYARTSGFASAALCGILSYMGFKRTGSKINQGPQIVQDGQKMIGYNQQNEETWEDGGIMLPQEPNSSGLTRILNNTITPETPGNDFNLKISKDYQHAPNSSLKLGYSRLKEGSSISGMYQSYQAGKGKKTDSRVGENLQNFYNTVFDDNGKAVMTAKEAAEKLGFKSTSSVYDYAKRLREILNDDSLRFNNNSPNVKSGLF